MQIFFILFVSLYGIFFCFPDNCKSDSEVTRSREKIQETTMSVNEMVDILMDSDEKSVTEKPKGSKIISRNPNDVEFYLYGDRYDTASNKKIIVGNKVALLASGYDPLQPLIIIIHGFSENYTSEFPQSTKDEYMDNSIKSNIILVDWGKLSTPTGGPFNFMLYPFAAENVITVGKRVAELLTFLITWKVLSGPEKVHMVGYDLGAHVAGVAANRVLLKNSTDDDDESVIVPATIHPVGRITGLDPTGPLFHMVAKQENKLDSTDATFVDVIHTNQGMIGYIGTVGHADFFPNGGGPFQPGCSQMVNSNGWCAHRKAFLYFIKSIADSTLKGCQCSSWMDVMCRSICANSALLGHHCSPNARGSYYLPLKTEEVNPNTGDMEMQMKMMSAFAPKKKME